MCILDEAMVTHGHIFTHWIQFEHWKTMEWIVCCFDRSFKLNIDNYFEKPNTQIKVGDEEEEEEKKIGRKLYKLWLYKEMKYVCYALRTYYRFWGKCPLKWNGNSIEKANTYTCEWEWRQNIQKSNRRKTDNRITHICAIVV